MTNTEVFALVRNELPESEDIELVREPSWSPIATRDRAGVRLEFTISGSNDPHERAAIVFLRFKDVNLRKLPGTGHYHQSSGSESFVYVDYIGEGRYGVNVVYPPTQKLLNLLYVFGAVSVDHCGPQTVSRYSR